MAVFSIKSFQQILPDMISTFLSKTGLNDLNPGSVLTTFLEAAAQEDAEQYFRIFQIILNYNLDTTEGEDLDDRAEEIFRMLGEDVGEVGVRLQAQKATSYVEVSDSTITKIQTTIFSGSQGPVAGATVVNADDASSFTPTGTLIIGRETNNAETVSYSSITNLGTYYQFNLSGAVTNDHGTGESIVLSQGGDRIIPAGTIVKVPESDTSREISFVLTREAIILDGDTYVSPVDIASTQTGSASNVPPNTIIQFENEPFTGALVTNPQAITNGTDRENDNDLRDRIKNYVQSLSRGTKTAILTGVLGIVSQEDNKRVVSANLVETNDVNERDLLYIDDGSGLEPSYVTVGSEQIVDPTTGGEKYFQTLNYPIVKAELETQSSHPYDIMDGDDLTIEVNNVAETLVLNDSDYRIAGYVTALEVATAINQRMSLIEARITDAGRKVVIRAKTNTNENLRVTGGSMNPALDFPLEEVFTTRLYRRNEDEIELLTKDGVTAEIENTAAELYNLSGGEALTIVVDGKTANPQTITFQVGDFVSPGFATAEEVVTRINLELSGAYSLTTSNGSKITIKSRYEDSQYSKIQITGGSANAVLSFSTVEVSGQSVGYTLNRFNGQIELVNEAGIGDAYEMGSIYTRGFTTGAYSETFTLTDGDTVTVSVDGGAGQTATFNTADFNDILNAAASEVAAVLNQDIVGAFASVTSDNRVTIRTNTWGATGSIEITGVTGTATALGFTIGTPVSSLFCHVANVVNTDAGPYALSEGDNLIIVLDHDSNNNAYNITMDLDGEVTIGDASAPYETLIAKILSTGLNFNSRFLNDDDLAGFSLKWISGDNVPTATDIASYVASSGLITLAAPLANTIDVGDQFVIVPKTAQNVVTYLNNSIVSSFYSKGIASISNGYVQLESRTVGTDGGVQVTGGSANVELQFSTSPFEGRDGYKKYSGLIEKVQHVLDGMDSDFETYPGIRAAGVQIEVLPPVQKKVTVNANISLARGFITSTVKDQVINAISSYINGLGVGDDIIVSEIIDRIMSIVGITDVELIEPASNVAIADNEKALIDENEIIVS